MVSTFTISGPSDPAEGNVGTTSLVFTVNRAEALTTAASVDWAVTGNGPNPASPDDFAGGVYASGTLNFGPGQTSLTITVTIQSDTQVEPNEGFVVTLSNPRNVGLLGNPASAVAVIVNDDSGPTLAALSLSSVIGGRGQPISIDIIGATAGSTISVASGALPDGLTLDSAARTISGTPNLVASSAFTLRETLAGAANTPRDTALSFDVVPTLNVLTLSTAEATQGSAITIAIVGTTAGSTISIAAGSLPAGLVLDSAARTISGTPNTVATSNFTLRETLAGAINSPRDSAVSVAVNAPVPGSFRSLVGSGSGTSGTLQESVAGVWYGALGAPNPILNGGTKHINENFARRPWRGGAILRNYSAQVCKNTRTVPSVWRTRINGANGQQFIPMPTTPIATNSAVAFSDPTNIDTIADGDLVNQAIAFEGNGALELVCHHLSAVVERNDAPTTWLASQAAVPFTYSTGNKRYVGLTGQNALVDAALFDIRVPAPVAGIFDRMQNVLTVASGATKVHRFEANGGFGNQQVPMIAVGINEDPTNIDTVAVGDLICQSLNGSGATPTIAGTGNRFRATTNGEAPMIAQGFSPVPGNGINPGNFWNFNNQLRRNNVRSEANGVFASAGVASRLCVRVAANVNATDLTFRTVNQTSNLNQIVTIPAGATGVFVDATNIDTLAARAHMCANSPVTQANGTSFASYSFKFAVAV